MTPLLLGCLQKHKGAIKYICCVRMYYFSLYLFLACWEIRKYIYECIQKKQMWSLSIFQYYIFYYVIEGILHLKAPPILFEMYLDVFAVGIESLYWRHVFMSKANEVMHLLFPLHNLFSQEITFWRCDVKMQNKKIVPRTGFEPVT